MDGPPSSIIKKLTKFSAYNHDNNNYIIAHVYFTSVKIITIFGLHLPVRESTIPTTAIECAPSVALTVYV